MIAFDAVEALHALNDEPLFEFEHPEWVFTAIRQYQRGKADVADCLIHGIGKEKRLELKTSTKGSDILIREETA